MYTHRDSNLDLTQMLPDHPMTTQPIRLAVQLCTALSVISITFITSAHVSRAQEIRPEDRIGSNKGFDMCEDFRFKRITKLVSEGNITKQQGYNIWKRIRSDKEALKRILSEAVAAQEVSQVQADRLLPLVDLEMTYFDTQHGRFGRPKELEQGQFKSGEVTAENRASIYKRLIAANESGSIYDYDVASIMKQLYAGFDEQTASIEDIAAYRGAMNPRIAQSGSQARILQSAKMQRDQQAGNRQSKGSYGKGQLKIANPSEWIKDLEEPIYSGPQPGEKVLPLTVLNLRGTKAGQEFDPIKLAGDKLHLMFFVSESRTFGRFLGQLRNQLQSIEANSKQPWAMSVIVSTDDVNEAEKSFAVLDPRYPKNLLVGVSKDGAAGPPAYGLDKNLTATVIVAKNGIVLHNLPYVGNAFYTQPHILGAIADAMKIDHDTLRKYIGEQPGDAAGAAAMRGVQRQGQGSAPSFREQLTPLVVNQKLSRGEAKQLLSSLNDTGELKALLTEFVQEDKLTRNEAIKLFGSRDPEDTNKREPRK